MCVCVCSLSLNEVHNLLISLLITENKHYIKLHKANIVEVCAAAGELGWPVDLNDVTDIISIYICWAIADESISK